MLLAKNERDAQRKLSRWASHNYRKICRRMGCLAQMSAQTRMPKGDSAPFLGNARLTEKVVRDMVSEVSPAEKQNHQF